MAGTTWIIVNNMIAAFKPVGWYGLDAKEQRATVSGNGGPAVMVGNWLYFVGGYVDTSTIRYRQNEYNKVTEGAIYRVYIDGGEAGPLCENEEDGRDEEETNFALTNPGYVQHLLSKQKLGGTRSRRYQIVVPKIAGFDQSALWVFDNHLVYTSPNNTRDKFGTLQSSRIDFFRVDLDGRNHRKIYTTADSMLTASDFTVTSHAGNVFLIVHERESTMLRRINVTGKNAGRVTTISKEVQSVAFPVVTSYSVDDSEDEYGDLRWDYTLTKNYAGIMSNVYYTENLSADDQKLGLTGNKVFQYKISDASSEPIEAHIPGHNISVLALSNGRLVYTVQAVGAENSRGVFATGTEIRENWNAPFSDVPKTEGSTVTQLDDYKLLEWWDIEQEELANLYLPSVITPGIPFRFATLVSSNNTMYVYEQENLGSLKFKTNPVAKISNVARIIMVTGNTVHYSNASGMIVAVDLNSGTQIANMGTLTPEASIRPWVISRGSEMTWYFHVKAFTAEFEGEGHSEDDGHDHVGESITVGMLTEMLVPTNSDKAREFVLSRLDCKFMNHPDDFECLYAEE